MDRKQSAKTKMTLGAGIKNSFKKIGNVFQNTIKSDDKIFSYLKTFADDKGVAAVMPSSRYLVGRTLRAMHIKHAKKIIEYGAAEGVMTRKILEEMPKDGKILSIELNDCFYEKLKSLQSDPRMSLYHGDVRHIDSIAKAHGFPAGEIDVIVSGIPFAFLSAEGRAELLSKTSNLLKPGGCFVAYQVTTHLIPILKNHFRKVKIEFEIRNIPPHFVFTAFK